MLTNVQGCEKQMRAVHKKLDVFLQGLLDARSEDLQTLNHDQGKDDDFMSTLLTHPTETTGKPMTADQIKGMLVVSFLSSAIPPTYCN